MNKMHCDLCDATPATKMVEREVTPPGRQFSTRNRLTVSITVYDKNEGEGRPDKDVCDDCTKKMVAEAFGLRTPEELYELRDQVTELTRQLALVRAGGDPPAAPAQVLVDPDIPF